MSASDREHTYRVQWEEMTRICKLLAVIGEFLEIPPDNPSLLWAKQRANEPDIARQIEEYRERAASDKLLSLRSSRMPFAGMRVDGTRRPDTAYDANDQAAEAAQVLASRGQQATRHAKMANDPKRMQALREQEAAKRKAKEAMYERMTREALEAKP